MRLGGVRVGLNQLGVSARACLNWLWMTVLVLTALCGAWGRSANAQDSVCAEVKIVIEQKLSPHAVIAADNVLFRGMVESDAPVPHRYRTLVVRLREYIAYVRTHYATVIYKDGDGLAVSYQLEMRN